MIQKLWSYVPRIPRRLGLISLLLIVGILVACLWPFHTPKNTVLWLDGSPGIAFGRHGLLLSSGPLTMPGRPEAASCTIELMLRRNRSRDGGTILAFYTPADPVQLFLYQWRTGLVVRTKSEGGPPPPGHAFFTADVLAETRPVFITITSGEGGTRVYADGVLRRDAPDFPITNRMLTGNIVAGTGATRNPWTGQIRGLAIYDREFTPAQVLDNYWRWTRNRSWQLKNVAGAAAVYLFDEGKGDIIHNSVPGASHLRIPDRYTSVIRRFLSPPTLDNGDDIVLNIAGFVPLGFFLFAYFATAQRTHRAMVLTIAVCAVLSISVESLQYFLPTRDSDATDVITNVLGGAIGALLYHYGSRHLKR